MENTKILTSNFDGVQVKSKHLKIVILIAMGLLFDMMDNYNFSYVAPTLMKEWGITVQQVGQYNSLFFLGMLFGSLVGGIIIFFSGYFWLEESPRWLVLKGRIAKAEKIVEKMTGFKADLSNAVQVVKKPGI